MLKKVINKTNNNKNLIAILRKYNISSADYVSVSRRMIARGVFIGVFIAMIPMPFQMLAVVLFTFVGKFNVPIALALCWITNPFTMPFIFYIEYLTGSVLLSTPTLAVELSMKWFENNFENILIPLYFGSIFYSIILSTMAYYSINYYWKVSVYKRRAKK